MRISLFNGNQPVVEVKVSNKDLPSYRLSIDFCQKWAKASAEWVKREVEVERQEKRDLARIKFISEVLLSRQSDR